MFNQIIMEENRFIEKAIDWITYQANSGDFIEGVKDLEGLINNFKEFMSKNDIEDPQENKKDLSIDDFPGLKAIKEHLLSKGYKQVYEK